MVLQYIFKVAVISSLQPRGGSDRLIMAAILEMKDMSECHHADDDAWGPATADHAAKNPPSPGGETEAPHSTTVLHEHHHVLDLFGLSEYDEYAYSGLIRIINQCRLLYCCYNIHHSSNLYGWL